MTDRELIKLCKKGDRKGQKLLFNKFSAAMTRLCLRYIKNEEETLEVVSEGFIKVFKHLQQFHYEREGGLVVWVKTIMVNESLQYLRKHKPMYVNIDDDHIGETVNNEALSEMDAEYIYTAILKLPDGYRTVFNLYVIEGYSHKEIAEKLQISEGSSRSQLTHARKKLQRLIQLKEVS